LPPWQIKSETGYNLPVHRSLPEKAFSILKRCEPLPVVRVDIALRKGAEEALDAEFYALSGGIWVEEQGASVLLKCYPTDSEAFLSYLAKSKPPLSRWKMVLEEEKDYVSVVRRLFTPVRVGDVTILPPWRKTKRKGPVIVIEPGMAFGTGRHESTRLMIGMMGTLDVKGRRVLDVGSGSGVLAVYARLLGAASVAAIDNDPLAVIAARKGFTLNRADDILLACAGPGTLKAKFDVVVANLDFDTFRKHGRDIVRLVDDGGYLIASGIEKQYAPQVTPLFEPMTPVRKKRLRDWYGFLFRLAR
jgi:ribosomal protein L11 methyltransferase